MRIGINVPEVLSAATFGAVLGTISFAGRAKWVRLGRDAYIAHYAQIFDKQTAHPPPLLGVMVLWILLALLILIIFKGLAFIYQFASGGSQPEKRPTIPPAKLLVDRPRPE